MTRIREDDFGARIEEGQLAQTMPKRLEVELYLREGLQARQERYLRAVLSVDVADNVKRRDGHAIAKLDEVLLACAPDAAFKPGR